MNFSASLSSNGKCNRASAAHVNSSPNASQRNAGPVNVLQKLLGEVYIFSSSSRQVFPVIKIEFAN